MGIGRAQSPGLESPRQHREHSSCPHNSWSPTPKLSARWVWEAKTGVCWVSVRSKMSPQRNEQVEGCEGQSGEQTLHRNGEDGRAHTSETREPSLCRPPSGRSACPSFHFLMYREGDRNATYPPQPQETGWVGGSQGLTAEHSVDVFLFSSLLFLRKQQRRGGEPIALFGAMGQTAHNHVFQTSRAAGPSLLLGGGGAGGGEDETSLAERVCLFGSRKNSHAPHNDIFFGQQQASRAAVS